MNRLSDKQLKRMIREALSRIEADCIAQHSPMAGLGMDVEEVSRILVQRAEESGQTWDDYIEIHDAVDDSYEIETKHSDKLKACKDEMEASAGRLANPPHAPRRKRRPITGMVGFRPSGGSADTTMPIGEREVKYMIREVLTVADETAIKKMIAKELSASQTDIGQSLKKAVEVELSKALKSKEMKNDVAEITKKILKRLYKDLSLQQPYVIDRIKV
jgi:hypothetical protein